MSGPVFQYSRATDLRDAFAIGSNSESAFLAGGTDFLQLWKSGASAPARIVDISRLPLGAVTLSGGDLSLGALARLSDVAVHADVVTDHPLIAEAILASACGQVRNMATVGGNLLQRTRCAQFRGKHFACNKLAPGSGCSARVGENRLSALFGGSASCVATHPSDLAVALVALDADVDIFGASGHRRIPLSALYRLPGDTPAQDTNLSAGELITAIHVTKAARFARHSTYLKVRDRASFEFAVLSVAAALRMEGDVIAEARLAAGGVAPMPWRLFRSEEVLIGQATNSTTFEAAADFAVTGAEPLTHNSFKVGMLRQAVIRVLQTLTGVR